MPDFSLYGGARAVYGRDLVIHLQNSANKAGCGAATAGLRRSSTPSTPTPLALVTMGIYPGVGTTHDVAWQIPVAPQAITVKVGDGEIHVDGAPQHPKVGEPGSFNDCLQGTNVVSAIDGQDCGHTLDEVHRDRCGDALLHLQRGPALRHGRNCDHGRGEWVVGGTLAVQSAAGKLHVTGSTGSSRVRRAAGTYTVLVRRCVGGRRSLLRYVDARRRRPLELARVVVVDAHGVAELNFQMPGFTLRDEMPVVGRAIVVHDAGGDGRAAASSCRRRRSRLARRLPGIRRRSRGARAARRRGRRGRAAHARHDRRPEPSLTGGWHIHSGAAKADAGRPDDRGGRRPLLRWAPRPTRGTLATRLRGGREGRGADR